MSAPSATRIDIEQAEAGMVLARDLKDATGAVLLLAGASLSEGNLASLRRRGVAACVVLLDSADDGGREADAAAAAAERARRLQRLAHLFRHSAGEQATPQLLRLLNDYHQNG
jgi:hypothetical protein